MTILIKRGIVNKPFKCLCLPSLFTGYTALKGGEPDDHDPNVPKIRTLIIDLASVRSMVSIPVIPGTNNLFPEALGVYSFDKGLGYVRIQTEEDMAPGKVYWILVNIARHYKLTGRALDEYSITLPGDGT